jgi:hypothetical protein
MAHITEHHIGFVTGNCTLCGKQSAAVWCGIAGDIEVCFRCAIDILPALIADSTPHLNHAYLHQTACRIERGYYRAMAGRAVCELENARKDESGGISDNLRQILNQHGLN